MTTKAKHTAGPWKAITDLSGSGKILAPDRKVVATITATIKRPYAEKAANAARIVACVNALEGIADPGLVRELIEAISAVNTIAWDMPKDAPGQGEILGITEAILDRLDGGKGE